MTFNKILLFDSECLCNHLKLRVFYGDKIPIIFLFIDTILYQKSCMFITWLDYRSTFKKELIFKLPFNCLKIKITLLKLYLVEIPENLRGIPFPMPLSHHSLKLLNTDVPTVMVIGEFMSTVSLKLSGRKRILFFRGLGSKKILYNQWLLLK